jgi:hypothetical protein
MGQNSGKHKVIVGDCLKTIPEFFHNSPGEIIALAFFDINAYIPTMEAFSMVWERLSPGGIVAFWQLTRDSVPAEGMVYVENILNKLPHKLFLSKIYPGLCYIKK